MDTKVKFTNHLGYPTIFQLLAVKEKWQTVPLEEEIKKLGNPWKSIIRLRKLDSSCFFWGRPLFVEHLGYFFDTFQVNLVPRIIPKTLTRNKKKTKKNVTGHHFLSNTFYVVIFEFPDFWVKPPSCFGLKKTEEVLSRRNRFERRYQRSRHWVPRILAFQVHKGELWGGCILPLFLFQKEREQHPIATTRTSNYNKWSCETTNNQQLTTHN